jgi:hypothetical protein
MIKWKRIQLYIHILISDSLISEEGHINFELHINL